MRDMTPKLQQWIIDNAIQYKAQHLFQTQGVGNTKSLVFNEWNEASSRGFVSVLAC